MIYNFVKHSHFLFIGISILLFNLRFWKLYRHPNQPLPTVLKVLPHLNDTTLLFTGLWLMAITHLTPFGNATWLGIKLILVVVYIVFGMKTLKATPRSKQFWIFYILSMISIAAIYYLARFKPIW